MMLYYHGNAVKRFWTLWDIIFDCVILRPWPAICKYFSVTEHSYCNYKIVFEIVLHSYYIFELSKDRQYNYFLKQHYLILIFIF